jgi:hypothetical protein
VDRGDSRNAYMVSVAKAEKRSHWEDLDVDGRIIQLRGL